MVTINENLIPTTCILVDPDNVTVGEIKNPIQLNDVRIQIAINRLIGYRIFWNGTTININPNGDLVDWPYGFYDDEQRQFRELFEIRKSRSL